LGIQRVEAAIEEHRDLPQREALRKTFAELVDQYVSDAGYTALYSAEQTNRMRQLAHLG
jgi:hypothetical protein